MDTAECNAEPPHLTCTTLINEPQEGCYMHVKITRAVNPASLTNNITAQTTRGQRIDDEKEMDSRRARTRTTERSTKNKTGNVQRTNVTKTEEFTREREDGN